MHENDMDQRLARWDIFCRVVDNYGDIGVTFRLARQLADEYGVAVRLWLDDLASLAMLRPETALQAARQTVAGVDVCRWDEPFDAAQPAQVVIEAFACGLPQAYLEAMAACAQKPVWINLEYLSAEAWVDDCHGMASRHPRLPLTQYFFFPGFSRGTGGLLRERTLLAERQAFRAHADRQQAFWQSLGINEAAGALKISLFGYSNPAVHSLLDSWASGAQAVLAVVPENRLLRDVEHYCGRSLKAGDELVHGSLRLVVLPFLPQDQYDRLLWACDINFVRGEDSFVRAQWAATPLVWQIYLQDENIHLVKLEAFLARYTDGLPVDAALALQNLWRDWNRQQLADGVWQDCLSCWPVLRQHAETWAASLAQAENLAAQLISFCKTRV